MEEDELITSCSFLIKILNELYDGPADTAAFSVLRQDLRF